jgi:hypothetical protein
MRLSTGWYCRSEQVTPQIIVYRIEFSGKTYLEGNLSVRNENVNHTVRFCGIYPLWIVNILTCLADVAQREFETCLGLQMLASA